MDTVVTLILPSCIIIVLNLQIIRAVTRINKDRRQVLYSHALIGRQLTNNSYKACPATNTLVGLSRCSSSKMEGGKKSNSNSKTQTQQSTAGQNRVTKMLLVVSTIFLLLTCLLTQ